MKTSRHLLILALGATLAALPALRAADGTPPPAGERGDRRERGPEMGDRMADELGLSADQKAKFKELAQKEKAEVEALRADTSVAKEDRRAKMQAIHKSYQDQRQALMTPDQRAKADKMRDGMEKRREKREDRKEKAAN
jgi:periplasmic protein CpxP/Spy